MKRKETKQIMVGGVPVGGGAPVSIQSMLNTRTTDVEGSLRQIRALAAAGCEIARLAVPDMQAAEAFGEICKASPLPLVADIHFDYRLAIRAAENGAAKIRINPGNIGGEDRVKAVVEACGARHIPIRIGVNGGSLEPRLLEKYGRPTPEALVESAFGHIALLDFSSISPCSMTTMQLALRTVDRRWAMTNTVRPSMRASMPCWIRASVRVSMEEVASSRIITGGSATAARAMASSWRWPWDRLAPSPVTMVW